MFPSLLPFRSCSQPEPFDQPFSDSFPVIIMYVVCIYSSVIHRYIELEDSIGSLNFFLAPFIE